MFDPELPPLPYYLTFVINSNTLTLTIGSHIERYRFKELDVLARFREYVRLDSLSLEATRELIRSWGGELVTYDTEMDIRDFDPDHDDES